MCKMLQQTNIPETQQRSVCFLTAGRPSVICYSDRLITTLQLDHRGCIVLAISLICVTMPTHTITQPFYGSTDFVPDTRVSLYQKKHSPTYTYRGHQSSLICFIHLLRSTASSQFNPCARQSFFTISLQVFFGLPLGLAPSTSYSIDFFIQSLSSFRNTCPYHRNLFRCSIEIMSSNPSLSLNPLLGILSCSFTPHIHLTILICAR